MSEQNPIDTSNVVGLEQVTFSAICKITRTIAARGDVKRADDETIGHLFNDHYSTDEDDGEANGIAPLGWYYLQVSENGESSFEAYGLPGESAEPAKVCLSTGYVIPVQAVLDFDHTSDAFGYVCARYFMTSEGNIYRQLEKSGHSVISAGPLIHNFLKSAGFEEPKLLTGHLLAHDSHDETIELGLRGKKSLLRSLRSSQKANG